MNDGPGMIRLAADIHRIADDRNPVLHEVSGQAADDSADQHDQGNFVVMKSDGFRQAFDGKRAIGVDLFVAGLVGCGWPRPSGSWTESNSAMIP